VLAVLAVLPILRVVAVEVGDTWRNIRSEFDRMHLATLASAQGTCTISQRTDLTPAQRTILSALALPEPPRFYDFTPISEPPDELQESVSL